MIRNYRVSKALFGIILSLGALLFLFTCTKPPQYDIAHGERNYSKAIRFAKSLITHELIKCGPAGMAIAVVDSKCSIWMIKLGA